MGLRLLWLYYLMFTKCIHLHTKRFSKIKLNILNSRMKYLHNIWFFPRTFDSKDETLVKAADKNGKRCVEKVHFNAISALMSLVLCVSPGLD